MSPATDSGRAVLVVEDDDATREAECLLLRSQGYEVASAADGREALDRLRAGLRPGAILLDLMMPVLDGYAFRAEQLRDPELGAIPVVVCSAAAELPGRADPLCPAAVLPKPVEPDEVGRAVGRALACGRQTAEAAACLVVRRAADLPSVLGPVAGAMTMLGYPPRDVFAVRLGLEEALVNAIRHGNRGDPGKRVRVRYRVTAEEVRAEVEDEGRGFDPGAVADPLDEAELARPCGRGLLLMRHYLDGVFYNEAGNAVTLHKRRGETTAEG
jgi:serine/threonine-protein kinase RsbW